MAHFSVTLPIGREYPESAALDDSIGRRAPRPRLGPAGAQLAGWLAVGGVNQVFVALSSNHAELSVHLVHHAYDIAQFTVLGALSFVVVSAARALIAKAHLRGSFTRWHALGLGLATFLVSLFIVGPDVRNAAGRYGVPHWLATLAGALAFGTLLAATGFSRVVRWRVRRALAAVLGLLAAVTNAFVLLGDYPAIHFTLAWLAAALFAVAAEGALPSLRMGRSLRWALLSLLIALGLASILVPPRQQVLARMYGVSSSVVAPYASRFYPKPRGYQLDLVRPEALTSPWFQDRRNVPSVPASGRLRIPKPRVVLIVVDTLRYDVVSEPKYLRKLPVFQTLHASGARFSNARTAATWTRASISALFSGRFYRQLHWEFPDGRAFLADDTPPFAQLLSEAGVTTTMLPFFSFLGAERLGIGKGFQAEIPGRFEADVVVKKVIELLHDSQGPSFIYAHMAEPHAPYRGRGTPFQRYVQDVGLVDTALLPLLDFLKSSKLAKNTLVLLTSDHGEAFGEHGTYFHARNVYEELAHVPLFAFGAKVVPREIAEPVTLIDLAPTILDLFGLPSPGTHMGQSLAPLLAGEDRQLERPIIVNSGKNEGFYFPDGLKVILGFVKGTVEVYDLKHDPAERNNLIDSGRADVRSAVETARMFFHLHQTPGSDSDEGESVIEGE